MSRARNRPPRLEPHVDAPTPMPAPTPEVLLERSKVAGPGASGPGPTEFRRSVERLIVGDRRALGELTPIDGITPDGAWSAITATFGATGIAPVIDAWRTTAAMRSAVTRVREAATGSARIAIATTHPASLLTVYLALTHLARGHGGEVLDLADFGPIRADGRTPRWLRWMGGVAVVSDGQALCATRDGEAAREWMFAIPRPALVVADGAFAQVAFERGIEVVALAGLDQPGLAVALARAGRGMVVPMHLDRPARAYAALEDLIATPTDLDPTGPSAVDPPAPETEV